jgi:hypothetical protein
LRRTVYGVAIVVAVTLAAQAVGRARRESRTPEVDVQVARFTHVEGKVQYERAGTFQWIDATPAVPLLDGDIVRTGRRAAATTGFPDSSYFEIRPDSLIRVLIPGLHTQRHSAPRPSPLPTDAALLVVRDLAPLALLLTVVGGLTFVVSRITRKMHWRAFRRRGARSR